MSLLRLHSHQPCHASLLLLEFSIHHETNLLLLLSFFLSFGFTEILEIFMSSSSSSSLGVLSFEHSVRIRGYDPPPLFFDLFISTLQRLLSLSFSHSKKKTHTSKRRRTGQHFRALKLQCPLLRNGNELGWAFQLG